MINKLIHQISRRKNFLIYSLIGVSGAGLDYLTFVIMVKFLPIHYLMINFISTTLGITNNFFLNAHFNFGVKDRMLKRFLSFYLIGMIGLLVASALLYLLVDIFSFDTNLSKLATIIFVVIIQFNLNKRISFSKKSTI